jgi:ADP-ribose pyrophosphatase
VATFEPLGESLIHHGHVIDLVTARFRAPDGSEIEREVVRHPGAVAVVPLLDSGEVVLVRQFRAPFAREFLEIPAGKLDVSGEALEEAARRELVEEVGLVPGNLEHLSTFHNSVGFCDEEAHVFLGTDLAEVPSTPHGVEEEHMEVVRLPLVDAPAWIAEGRITDAKTVIGLLGALQRVDGSAITDG